MSSSLLRFAFKSIFLLSEQAITIRKTRKEEEHENKQKINNKIATCEKKDTDKCYNSLLKLIEKNTEVKTVFENPDLITDRNVSI